MRLERDTVLNLLAGLVLVAIGAWFVMNTEWVEVEVPVQVRGEAAKDRHYAVKKIAERLGAKVVSPLNLDRLPPSGATLVLNSWSWDLFPEREEKLRQWVESGGHLVTQSLRLPKWVPVESRQVKRPAPAKPAPAAAPRPDDEDDEEDDDAPAAAPPRPAPAPASAPPGRPIGPFSFRRPLVCHEVKEGDAVPPAYGTPRSYKLCNSGTGYQLVSRSPQLWALSTEHGAEVLRIAQGRGSVTIGVGDWVDNNDVFEGDNALAYMAMLQARPGRELWFVTQEARLPLLTLVWRHGAPAVLLFVLLLALVLWRHGRRFGPGSPVPPLARRSVAEQIRGTAGFIFRRDAVALHRAQLRVLEQAARRRIRDHDRLELRARAEAIARATGLDAESLARAMNTAQKRPRRELIATLTLLETAARRLTLNR